MITNFVGSFMWSSQKIWASYIVGTQILRFSKFVGLLRFVGSQNIKVPKFVGIYEHIKKL